MCDEWLDYGTEDKDEERDQWMGDVNESKFSSKVGWLLYELQMGWIRRMGDEIEDSFLGFSYYIGFYLIHYNINLYYLDFYILRILILEYLLGDN